VMAKFRWQPAQLVPKLMLLAVFVEFAMRFLPPSWIAARGTWESAIRYLLAANMIAVLPFERPGLAGRIELAIDPKDPRQGSFEINRRIENLHSYGDLASLSNLPQYRHYRVERFTTDDFGFRNRPPSPTGRSPDAIVVGTSFIAGPGTVDEETLPEQLAARSGRAVYNAGFSGRDAATTTDVLGFVRRAARRLGLKQGLVIFEYKVGEARLDITPGELGSQTAPSSAAADGPIADAARPWAAALRGWLALSRLEVLAQRAYKSIQNDRLLPNIHSKQVFITHLPGGDAMAFAKVHTTEPPETLMPQEIEYFKWFGQRLAQDRLKLVVLLVPRGYIVYGDIVTPPLPNRVGLAHYRALQERLEAAGIAVVNTVDALRHEARVRLSKREYMFHLDDSHWNAQGISVAVDEILRNYPAIEWPDPRKL
jgi:SGNH hydrolase-like domain, acetyltransferase AlgX